MSAHLLHLKCIWPLQFSLHYYNVSMNLNFYIFQLYNLSSILMKNIYVYSKPKVWLILHALLKWTYLYVYIFDFTFCILWVSFHFTLPILTKPNLCFPNFWETWFFSNKVSSHHIGVFYNTILFTITFKKLLFLFLL